MLWSLAMATNQKTLPCPICKKQVAFDTPDVPFCSDRCRLIDLGKWASGEYRISSPVMDPELLEELDNAEMRRAQKRDDDF